MPSTGERHYMKTNSWLAANKCYNPQASQIITSTNSYDLSMLKRVDALHKPWRQACTTLDPGVHKIMQRSSTPNRRAATPRKPRPTSASAALLQPHLAQKIPDPAPALFSSFFIQELHQFFDQYHQNVQRADVRSHHGGVRGNWMA